LKQELFAAFEARNYLRPCWFGLNTPKALANVSPRLKQPWDQVNTIDTNAESVGKGGVTVRQRFQRFCGFVIGYLGLFQPWDQVNTIDTNAESVGKGYETVRQRFQRFCGL